jgi:hypothetical protein
MRRDPTDVERDALERIAAAQQEVDEAIADWHRIRRRKRARERLRLVHANNPPQGSLSTTCAARPV